MSAEQSTSEHGWAALHVLLGQWVGVGEPGEGTGWFSGQKKSRGLPRDSRPPGLFPRRSHDRLQGFSRERASSHLFR